MKWQRVMREALIGPTDENPMVQAVAGLARAILAHGSFETFKDLQDLIPEDLEGDANKALDFGESIGFDIAEIETGVERQGWLAAFYDLGKVRCEDEANGTGA